MSEHEATLAALREIVAELREIKARIAPAGVADEARVLSLSQVAKRLRKRYTVAREMVESGVIPGRREDGRWFIPAAGVEDYLARRLDGAA